MSLEILVPTPAIRNLIRDDKMHQIYGAMQAGQEKLGMQTANQSLAQPVHEAADHARDGARRLVEPRRTAGHDQPRRRRGRRRRTGPAAGGRRRPVAASESGRGAEVSMPTFAYSRTDARRRDRQRASAWPTRWTRPWPRCVASRSWSPDHSGQGKAEGGQEGEGGRRRQEGRREEPGGLHPPVLGDDRRRPAARAVPRHPRQPGRGQELRRGHSADAVDVESGASLADAMRKHPKTFDPLFTT